MAASETTFEICSSLLPKKQMRTIGAETFHPQTQLVEFLGYEPPKDSWLRPTSQIRSTDSGKTGHFTRTEKLFKALSKCV